MVHALWLTMKSALEGTVAHGFWANAGTARKICGTAAGSSFQGGPRSTPAVTTSLCSLDATSKVAKNALPEYWRFQERSLQVEAHVRCPTHQLKKPSQRQTIQISDEFCSHVIPRQVHAVSGYSGGGKAGSLLASGRTACFYIFV